MAHADGRPGALGHDADNNNTTQARIPQQSKAMRTEGPGRGAHDLRDAWAHRGAASGGGA